ncbi:MAG: HAD-IA family hydrolase [Planctomycetota bacterium]|nr:HAD-IA family hydrolase [Planctomycetota bacterium]
MAQNPTKRLPVLLCDLDGTLIDSLPLILQGYAHTLDAMGLGEVSEPAIAEHLGMPLREHLGQWFSTEADRERSVAIYRKYVLAAHDDSVKAFPDVQEALFECRRMGVRLGVVTSKTRAIAKRGLELTGMGDLFEVFVAAGDTPRGKPHPDPLLSAAETLGVAPESAAYLGDTDIDMQAARAAGMRPLVAGWGVRGGSLRSSGPHTWLHGPGELLAAL